MIRMVQRIAGVRQRTIRALIDLNAFANTHRRGNPRQHLGMHRRERRPVRGLTPGCSDSAPRQPTPALPEVVCPAGIPGTATVAGPISYGTCWPMKITSIDLAGLGRLPPRPGTLTKKSKASAPQW